MTTISSVSSALDTMFDRPGGLYGSFEDLPVISMKGHERRVALLESLDVGDVSQMAVADFGMGSWGFGSVYPKLHNCAKAIGFDISQSAIRLTQELIANSKPKYADHFEAHQSDGMDLPITDSSVDLFFSGESIEHVKFPLRFLSEIYRVLTPDGQLVITTPNKDAIKYKEKGEEYCASPEHFWLFNHEELKKTVEVYFDIVEEYGFNGSFGGYDEDREITDPEVAEQWSRQFEREPWLATGIIMRLKKKANVNIVYHIHDIPAEDIETSLPQSYLDLEFGLKGLLLETNQAFVKFKRPPSDGVVCRFWAHRWSGFASIQTETRSDLLDLYSYDPGWKVWCDFDRADTSRSIRITPAFTKNEKSHAPQVLFFEAFTWTVSHRDGSAVEHPRPASSKTDAPKLGMREGYGFGKFQPFVGTTVFHWFTAGEGNVRGPWQPIGGRQSWTGDVGFWRSQIKEMMLANIDAIYVHLIEQYEEPRIALFEAYSQLRAEGFDVPKIAPFIDPNILFAAAPIDVSSDKGKDEYCRHFVRFFEQYFTYNTDAYAHSYLLTVDNRLVLTSWWAYWLLRNLEKLTAQDIVKRLKKKFTAKIPQLNSGIYMMSCALIDPDYSFTDERMVMFSGYSYAIHSVHKGVDVWHVQPGYWDQNIRQPGYLLPRDGGKNYRRAWDAVVSAMPHVHRVYVESWNEYDEGSGIYSADPDSLFADPAMHSNTDTFSDTNNPYEYVITTADGASKINGKPAWDCIALGHNIPSALEKSTSFNALFTFQNRGNMRWLRDGSLQLLVKSSDGSVQQGRFHSADPAAFESAYGYPSGYPTTWSCELKVPSQPGRWPISVMLVQEREVIGQPLTLSVDIQ